MNARILVACACTGRVDVSDMVMLLGASSLDVGAALPVAPNEPSSAFITGHSNPAPSNTPSSIPWVPPWQKGTTADPFAPIVIEYISPSALETFDDETETADGCNAKWGFTKLDRIAKQGSAATELGTATHAQHERRYLHGTPYDLTTRAGELALATHHLLPEYGTFGLRVEQELRFRHPSLSALSTFGAGDVTGLSNGQVWFGGKIDLNWAEQRATPVHTRGGVSGWLRRIVLDHKTSGSVEHMKLTRAKLLQHPQAPIYAEMFFLGVGEQRIENDPVQVAFGTLPAKQWIPWEIDPAQGDIELRWNYVRTKGKAEAFPSWHSVTREEIEAHFEAYVARPARRLIEVVQQANESRARGVPFGANNLKKNLRACSAFGGCPFKDRCGVTPLQGIVSMTDPAGSFMSRVGIQPGAPGANGQGGPGWQNNIPPGAPPGAPPNYATQPGWQPPPAHQDPGVPPGGYGQPPGGQPPGYGAPAGTPPGYGAPAGAPPGYPPQNGAPPPGWQPPGAPQAHTQPGYPPGTQPGYGAGINPPENGTQPAPGTPGGPAAPAPAKKGRGKAKAAAAPSAPGAPTEEAEAIDHKRTVLIAAALQGLTQGLSGPLLQGQLNPDAVSDMAIVLGSKAAAAI